MSLRGGEIRQGASEVPDRKWPCDQPVNHEPAHVDVGRNPRIVSTRIVPPTAQTPATEDARGSA